MFVATTLAAALMACGSTTVIDGGSEGEIGSDVTPDDAVDGGAGSEDTTLELDTTASDGGSTSETSAGDTTGGPCSIAGCPCEGPDGCESDLVCAGGLCCQPDCDGKACGDDGCGGSCGSCEGNQECNQYGACMVCEPGAPVCLGNSVSTCNDSGDGYIGVPQDCSATPETPLCEGGICVCVSECEGKVCGDDGCGGSCGSCEDAGTECSEGQCVCAPQCDGMECGDDGCGDSCGVCESGVCTQGLCEILDGTLGDTCANPYVIDGNALPFNISQASTVLAEADELLLCETPIEPVQLGLGPDEVYKVVAPEEGLLKVGFSTYSDVGESHWPMIVYLRSSCQDTCPDDALEFAVENQSTVMEHPVSAGELVYIVIDGLGLSDMGTYNLNVSM